MLTISINHRSNKKLVYHSLHPSKKLVTILEEVEFRQPKIFVDIPTLWSLHIDTKFRKLYMNIGWEEILSIGDVIYFQRALEFLSSVE